MELPLKIHDWNGGWSDTSSSIKGHSSSIKGHRSNDPGPIDDLVRLAVEEEMRAP